MEERLVRKVGHYRALRDAHIDRRLNTNAAGLVAALFLILLRSLSAEREREGERGGGRRKRGPTTFLRDFFWFSRCLILPSLHSISEAYESFIFYAGV